MIFVGLGGKNVADCFWPAMPCGIVSAYHVSKGCIASIFRVDTKVMGPSETVVNTYNTRPLGVTNQKPKIDTVLHDFKKN
jgi:hypothetical protein